MGRLSPTFVPTSTPMTRDPQAWETRAALLASWSAWAIKAGEPIGTQKSFVQNTRLAAIAPSASTPGAASEGSESMARKP